MSLNLLQTTVPIEYELCQPGEVGIYNPALCNPPVIYRETIQTVHGFWYDSNKDKYVMILLMSQASWPGWRINSYEIDAETGLTTSVTRDRGGAVSLFWTASWGAGDFNKVYALTVVAPRQVQEVDPDTLTKTNTIFLEADLNPTPFINRFVLNRADGKVLLDTTSTLEVHDYNTNTLLGEMAMPMLTTQDMDYEDNERAWIVAENIDGTTMVMKVNYNDFQFESLTRLQDPPTPASDNAIAYDSKRKTVGIFRVQPDAVDGAAQHILEIYKPFSVATGLTEPVPVTRVVKDQVATFSAHLYGDGGEVGQLKPVTVSNTGDGTILQTTVTPQSNGAVTFQYQAGSNPGTDTITIEADL